MIVTLEKTDIHATLTTWIYCAFAQLYAAEQLGFEGYIHWPSSRWLKSYQDQDKFRQLPNAYDWYFKQPMINQTDHYHIWTWEAPNWGSHYDINKYQLMAEPLSTIKSFYKKHLKFSDVVNEHGEALVKKYNLDFSKLIGITWRGTDIYLDGRPRMPIETYFPFIDDILEKEPDLKLVCTAEETQILDSLLARYPNAFVIEEFYQAPNGSKDNPERFSPFSGFERGLQPALMVWLFSKCAYYIKNRSSTGAVASWISDGHIVSLGHPENLGFPANTDTAEIKGKLYPLNRSL